MKLKRQFILLLAAGLPLAGLRAGTIYGHVTAQGRPEAEQASDDGAYESRKLKFAEKVDYAALRDFVVAIEGSSLTNRAFPAPYEPVKVETHRVNQDGASFSPHVLPILVGTTVDWPNNDRVYHNVFSMSDTKTFDLGLYKKGDVPKPTKFEKPGRVDVYCSIHANMHCIILVMDNPYFSATDGRNNYRIPNVPPGRYTIKAWHERVPPQEQEVVVPEDAPGTNGVAHTEGASVKVDFTLGWGGKQ